VSTIAQALAIAAAQGLARLDAQLLLLHGLERGGLDRSWLIAHDTDEVGPAALARFEQLCARRAAGEPLAYLVGHKEFYGLPLQVDARVLVPRPETELLVEWALACIAHVEGPRVIDLGTGSGAIAIALAHSRPDARVEAVDRSAAALQVAQANAAALGARVAFREADWLAGAGGGWHLVVSNPPYVASADPHLAALRHEPLAALAAGPDGLDDIRRIVAAACDHLAPGGWLLLEHGHDQAAAVRALLAAAGLAQPESRRDLAGIERCSGARRLELG
jgi:release factor glutamine methyltransferase